MKLDIIKKEKWQILVFDKKFKWAPRAQKVPKMAHE